MVIVLYYRHDGSGNCTVQCAISRKPDFYLSQVQEVKSAEPARVEKMSVIVLEEVVSLYFFTYTFTLFMISTEPVS